MDELTDGIVKFIRVAVEFYVELTEIFENELLSLTVLQEK